MVYVGAQLDDEFQEIYGRNKKTMLHTRRLTEDYSTDPPGLSFLFSLWSAAEYRH